MISAILLSISRMVSLFIKVIVNRQEKKGLASISFGGGKKKVKTDDIVMFTRQMSAMVSAGVPLLRALSSQHDHML